MHRSPLYAVVMAGGSGTRFWPASRKRRPKQFLPISAGRAMLAETCARLEGLVDWQHTLVVSAESQAELVRGCLPELPRENLLCEPCARNTAAAVALAAVEIERRAPEAVQLVLPADHVIAPTASFRASLAAAAEEARASQALLTFGIRPTFAATGYGYIECGEQLGERAGQPVLRVARFVEKPARAKAEEFLATGRFLWNAGIFAWSTRAILAAFERDAAAILAPLRAARTAAQLAACYPKLPAQPVDIAILEKAPNVRTLPIDYTWNDVGSWAALPEIRRADEDGNFAFLSGGARLIAEQARGCVVYAEGAELIALVGVEDLVVVRAGGATLVCPRERAQDVKKIVERLEKERGEEWL